MKNKENKQLKAEKAKFLRYVAETAKYWASLPGKTALEVANGTAFSILVALDGEACYCGPYAVRPIDEDGLGTEGVDIAGQLHEEFNIRGAREGTVLRGMKKG
jgi:hypothetical protein